MHGQTQLVRRVRVPAVQLVTDRKPHRATKTTVLDPVTFLMRPNHECIGGC